MEARLTIADVVCPFCSLACDDLTVEANEGDLQLSGPECAIARAGFGRYAEASMPMVEGEQATLATAVARAASLLSDSRMPLFAGLGTDVAGMREILALAERTGGIVDHAGSRGLMANLRAQQDGGWVTATLAEVRNRADLLLFVGTDAASLAPRLAERCLAPRETLFGPLMRRLVYLGDGLKPAEGLGSDITSLPCPHERLPEVVGTLRALVVGARLARDAVVGLELAALQSLADRLRAARYAVIVWAATDAAGRHPDLLTGSLAGLTRELNGKTRCAGLPLAGPDNVIGANQVCAWQTGGPLRTSFASGGPDHDPARWNTDSLLASGGVDCMLWLAALRDQQPPATSAPTIALFGPGMQPARPVDVAIPVGTPGLDHGGSIYRMDGVVSLPLRPLRQIGLPSAAEVVRQIATHL